MKGSSSRREFLVGIGAAAALSTPRAAGASPASLSAATQSIKAIPDDNGNHRTMLCEQIRKQAASVNARMPIPANQSNSDEQLYAAKVGSYHKGLPHSQFGEVDLFAYRSLMHALEGGRPLDFERIRLGGNLKLSDPQGGLAFDLEGCDSHRTFMTSPPPLASAWRAGEAVEDYWMVVLRDVNFSDYASNVECLAAIAELNQLSDFRGPRQKNRVTPRTLFRGCTAGDSIGPYISQFLLQPFWFGAFRLNQQYSTYVPGLDLWRFDWPVHLAISTAAILVRSVPA